MTESPEREARDDADAPSQEVAGGAASRFGSALAGAARAVGRAIVDATQGPELKIVAFKLPTSPGQGDYCFVFDLDEVFELLHKRVNLRAQFEVWSADGIAPDLDHLGRELWVNFVHQYEEERDASFDVRFGEMEDLEDQISEIDARHSTVKEQREKLSIIVTIGMMVTAVVLGILAIPLILFAFGSGLVLLPIAAILAWCSRIRGQRWLRLVEEEGELEKQGKDLQRQYAKIERQLHAEMKRLEAAFNLTQGRYHRGSIEIDVKRHHQIAALARDLFEHEESPADPNSKLEEEITAPDIYPFLQTDFYLRWTSDSLQPRVRAWVDEKTDRQALREYQSTVRSLEFLGSEE